MKKKLYIRFFEHNWNDTPVVKMHCLGNSGQHLLTLMDSFDAYRYDMIMWSRQHPKGKVDLVWLPD